MMFIGFLAAAVIIYFLLNGKDVRTVFAQKSSPEQILKTRYAKGEISEEELRSMLGAIKE